MADGLKKTASHAAIYGIGTAIQSAIGFLMLPIYTRFLSPADYGTISMLQILLDLTSVLFGMQIAIAVFRHYFKETDPQAQREVLATALGFTIVSKGIGALALVLFSGPAAYLVFGGRDFESYVAMFALALLTDSLSFIPFQYIRIRERPFLFVGLSVVKVLVQLSLNLWFIVHLQMGVQGVIYSTVLSGALVGGGMALWLLMRTRWLFRWQRAKGLLSYSWPLIGSGLLDIGMASGSRLTLSHFYGLGEVGQIALAGQFAIVLRSLVWQPFNQVWGPQRFRLAAEADAKPSFQRSFSLIAGVLILIGTGIAVLSEDVIRVMSNPAFHRSALIVPILVFSELIRCVTMFANTPLLIADRTKELLRSNLLAALVLVITLALLVPPFGMLGAAISGSASVLTRMWWTTTRARAEHDLGLPWLPFWYAVVLAALVTVAASLAPERLIPSVASKLGLLTLFALLLYYSPLLGPKLRKQVSEAVATLVRRGSKPS